MMSIFRLIFLFVVLVAAVYFNLISGAAARQGLATAFSYIQIAFDLVLRAIGR